MKWSELALRLKIIIGLLFVVGALAGASAIYNWYFDQFKPQVSQTNFTAAPDNKKARKVTREKIKAVVPIEVYNKEEISKQLKIADPDKSNPNIQFPDAKTIPASDNDTSVVAKWDMESGKITIDARQEPLSFFGFKNDLLIYAEGGMNTKGSIEIGAGLQWDFARVANANIGAVGEIRGEQDNLMVFAGLRFTYHRRR